MRSPIVGARRHSASSRRPSMVISDVTTVTAAERAGKVAELSWPAAVLRLAVSRQLHTKTFSLRNGLEAQPIGIGSLLSTVLAGMQPRIARNGFSGCTVFPTPATTVRALDPKRIAARMHRPDKMFRAIFVSQDDPARRCCSGTID